MTSTYCEVTTNSSVCSIMANLNINTCFVFQLSQTYLLIELANYRVDFFFIWRAFEYLFFHNWITTRSLS
jgi:hypothetical protein